MALIRRRRKGIRVKLAEMEELQPVAPKPRLKRRQKRQIRLRAKQAAAAASKQAVRSLRKRTRIKVVAGGRKGQVLDMPLINAEGRVNSEPERPGKRSSVTGDIGRSLKNIGKSFIDSLTKVR